MDEPMRGAIRQNNWFVILDPSWTSVTPWSEPPAEVIVGGWMVDEDGGVGPFQPNPYYIPKDPDAPTDPTDAVLHLIAEGQQLADDLIGRIRDSMLHIACDDKDRPVLSRAPDGAPCVLVVTAERHKQGALVPRWRSVAGAKLPEIIPDGVDILLNPAGPAPFRLVTATLRAGDDTPDR
ncbi:type VII secretion system-associated protein [Nocardia sp. NPDC051787]|uniref:type VII secretion system-associated protein n=1 Tax=Nocardia sp. NPDC051787 TaxID=3155415 RepID=UPI00344654A6